jgi:phosphonopyruvate decarboxylase
MMKSDECLKELARLLPDQIVVATYRAAFEWMAARPSDLNYLSVGAMGLASSHGLGLALGRPDQQVIVLDGDGSLLMNLGSLVTIAEAAPKNLIHCVFGNGTYAVNGGHPIPGAGTLDFAGLAHAAGYRKVLQCADIARLSEAFAKALRQDGPIFVDLRVEHEGEIPLDYDALFSAERRRLFKTALDRA